ncbi:MAG: RT0821/Lpp0805 family surface protein [Burkholderiales bacterium]
MTAAKKVIGVALVLAVLSGCESIEAPSKQNIGMATGAILGGVVGHQIGHGAGQTVATIGGAALGAFVGGRVGARMDRNDQLTTAQALETSKNGQATTWRNPDTRDRYTVTPTRTYESASGPCREFTTLVSFDDGRRELVHGNACRHADGTWKAT